MSLNEQQVGILSWIFTIGCSILLVSVNAIILYLLYLLMKIIKNFAKKY